MNNLTNCTICLCATDNDDSHVLECNHSFHVQCILQWYRSGHSSCPNCRSTEFQHLGFSNAKQRASILRQRARRKDAPEFLKKAVQKVKRCQDRTRKKCKSVRAFRKKHRATLQRADALDKQYWRAQQVEKNALYQLGCMDVTGVVVPPILTQEERPPSINWLGGDSDLESNI